MEYYKPLRQNDAIKLFANINANENNSYHSGYEYLMNDMPVAKNENDRAAIALAGLHMTKIADQLKHIYWLTEDWPPEGQNNREILAIDKHTGAELLIVRWNVPTPIHGHNGGHMIDVLVSGVIQEIDYAVIDNEKRIVKQIQQETYFSKFGSLLLVNGYWEEGAAKLDAFVHKTIPISHHAVTLHLVPAHPRDGIGNSFTEQ